ncbi:MAG TPA: TIGR02757 family protein [Polyangiaceae bacterium]
MTKAALATHARLKKTLEDVRDKCDVAARIERDPVGLVRAFADPLDRELVGLVAASIAFGNARTICNKLQEILDRLGGAPRVKAEDARAVKKALAGFRHRVFTGDDVARLLIGARRVQKKHGSLGARFEGFLEKNDFREALAKLCDEIRVAGEMGARHILPDVRAGSAVKRLVLWVKWMSRPDDGVDMGQWNVPTSSLVIPVDVHIHKLARNLGLTDRNDTSWKTATEITAGLAKLDRDDPTKYDFSLCHLGMLQRCPSRRDPKRCEGCPVKPMCRHWA